MPSIGLAAVNCSALGSAGSTVVSDPTTCAGTSASTWSTGDVQITSAGVVSASNSGAGLLNSGVTGTLTNAGIIGTTRPTTVTYGLGLDYSASLIDNQAGGLITSSNGRGIMVGIANSPTIGAINNSGTISGVTRAIDIENGSVVNAITNNSGGSIAGGSYGVYSFGSTINTITNNSGGSISGTSYGIYNFFGSTTTIINNGTISSSGGEAIYNNAGSGAVQSIDAITNNVGGNISGGSIGIHNANATIGTITNYGTITGGSAGIFNDTNGAITRLNNAQSGLTYAGTLPTYYNIIIKPTGFGTLDGTPGIAGSTTFGVSSLSTLSANTYSGILLGISSIGIANYSSIFNTWTNFDSSYKWQLSSGVDSTTWNLVVAALAPPPPVATDISGAGNSYMSSNLGTTVNPVFDGGTLQVSSAGNITNNFTVNSNNGVINQNGVASNFTGVISNAVSGTPGSMTISNSGSGGSVTFSGANTYTGSTTVNSGATLALAGAGTVASSSGVINNGTFNIAGKTGNVTVNAYAQGSTGSLAMSLAPGAAQQLKILGAASLAGGLSLTAGAGSYAPGKYTLLTANGVTGSFDSLATNLSSYTRLGYALAYDANDVYLVFTPNVADTQQSLVNTAASLQNIYTLQNSVLANSFGYDCTEFGANGICVSAGGRNTAVSAANGLNNTSGLLIAAYRPHQNYRVGAYIDQNLSVNNAGSTVNLGNNTPVIGVFGAWNERVDGTGTEVKVAAAYGQKNTTINRQIVGTSEAGSGSSNLTSQGAQVTAKYGFGVADNVIVSPYVGMRYTQNNMGGYTEGASSSVTSPLTYSALNTNATTALAGVGASYKVIPQTTLFASAGVETDTNTANGTYSASGLAGLTPVNFNANPVKTRSTATVGAYYDVEKNQRLGVTGIYRQEPFQAVSTTTVMATYTVGM